MAPYDDWNKIEDDEDEELQDYSVSRSPRRFPTPPSNSRQLYEGKRDVILFCIDCSPSMLELREDPRYEDVQTCNLMVALEAAMQIQKRKVLVGPNDSVGVVLFNTVSASAIPAARVCNVACRRAPGDRQSGTKMGRQAQTSRRAPMCISR